MSRRRRMIAMGATPLVGALLAISAAFACDGAALLRLTPATGAAGSQVTVTGTAFWVATPAVGVVLHWNGADGPVLATAVPDKAGTISATFTVPDGPPGYYVVVAVQRDATGADKRGTPSRAAFRIGGPVVTPPAPVTTSTTRRPATTTSSTSTSTSTSTSSTSSTSTSTSSSTTSTTALDVVTQQVAANADPSTTAVAAGVILLIGAGVSLFGVARGRRTGYR